MSQTLETSLLLTLEEISQLVAHSHDPHETLSNIVHLIQRRFHTDVCSVYLLEQDTSELVLGATVGLKQESVGRVRMRLDEGLTGLTAQQMRPVTVSDAFAHPRFKYFPEAGEDPYRSFLGVPLLEAGLLHGVLVIQTTELRTFAANEVRMLVTVGSQLASLVAGAQLVERIVAFAHEPPPSPAPAPTGPTTLQGVGLSKGHGIGEVYIVNGFDEWLRSLPQQGRDVALEAERLAQAMQAARRELTHLSQRISAMVGEDHGAILQAQLMLMSDRTIEDDVTRWLATGLSAEAALVRTLETYVAAFQKLQTPLFQERVHDIKDVFRRLLWHLQPHGGRVECPEGRLVLVLHEASVLDLFSVDLERLAGIVLERGGQHSHAAILARSLHIPMVSQLPGIIERMTPGRLLLVDGDKGTVQLDPPALPTNGVCSAALPTYEPVAAAAPVLTGPQLLANVNLLCEVPQALAGGAAGVGLYRTEFLFLARRTLPTEDEQVGIYRKLLQRLGGLPASIRTFDLRPDKLAQAQLHSPHGSLDWRLVLESPSLQKLFKDQVRAILRAAVVGQARILVPFVTRSEQMDFILETVHTARAELDQEGLEHSDNVPLGVVIEVAGAVPLVSAWAEQLDFFALGTNDLIASALGIDRDQAIGGTPHDLLHPGLLRMVHEVVSAAHEAQRPVCVCGEMAADPEGALALTALRVDALSVPVTALGAVRATLQCMPDTMLGLADELLRQRRAVQTRALLQAMR